MTERPPLRGITVLDFTQNLPGPYATAMLASLGAEVIKIEPEKGDTARGVGAFFDLVNGGKKSVAADLKNETQRAAVARLARSVDVVVEGFRPGVMAEFGLDAETLRAANPRLVYCSISAYGQDGPYRDHPAHDLNLQALVGACDLGRDEHEKPRGGALPVADLSSSMTAALAIVAALYDREKTGQGRTIDVALSDTIASWTYLWGEGLTPSKLPLGDALPGLSKRVGRSAASWASKLASALSDSKTRKLADSLGATIRASERFRALERARLHALPHYGTFRCKDGKYIAIGIVDEDKFWSALCHAIGLETYARVPLPMRLLLGPQLRARVAASIAKRTREEWLAQIDLDAVPISRVLHFSEALDDPQLRHRRGRHASNPIVPKPLAARIDEHAPRLGEHNRSILGTK